VVADRPAKPELRSVHSDIACFPPKLSALVPSPSPAKCPIVTCGRTKSWQYCCFAITATFVRRRAPSVVSAAPAKPRRGTTPCTGYVSGRLRHRPVSAPVPRCAAGPTLWGEIGPYPSFTSRSYPSGWRDLVNYNEYCSRRIQGLLCLQYEREDVPLMTPEKTSGSEGSSLLPG
jgi:hypothetical protein